MKRIVVDTDAGADDMMALAYLLGRPDVLIDGITVVNGLASVDHGVSNILRFLSRLDAISIPVFAGARQPMVGNSAFPQEWRTATEALDVGLPSPTQRVSPIFAPDFLVTWLSNTAVGTKEILCLGPLTNIALACQKAIPDQQANVKLLIMGGAIGVEGNLYDLPDVENRVSEWNMYIDAAAARVVWDSHFSIDLIPLDATNMVPIDADFVRALTLARQSAHVSVVQEILMSVQPWIIGGRYFAWDPLAAVALVNPMVVDFRHMPVQISLDASSEGQTVRVPKGKGRLVRVATGASRLAFQSQFIGGLASMMPSTREDS